MKCKVVCSSLGYNGRIYPEGEYVDVDSPKELKRLGSYKVIEVGQVEVPALPAPLTEEKDPVKRTQGGKKKK